jgi:hypothetical protein
MADGAGNQRANDHSLMSAHTIIFGYVTLLLGGLVALTIYSEMRRRRFRPSASEDRIFRCEKCGFVYTDDPDVDRSRCSQCGKSNTAIQF